MRPSSARPVVVLSLRGGIDPAEHVRELVREIKDIRRIAFAAVVPGYETPLTLWARYWGNLDLAGKGLRFRLLLAIHSSRVHQLREGNGRLSHCVGAYTSGEPP